MYPPLDSADSLIVSPDPIALGVLTPGHSAQTTVTIRNQTSEAVMVRRFETTCPCILVTPVPIRVGPRGTASLVVTFDPKAEPDFRGSLSVDVVGYADDGGRVLRATADIDVRRLAPPSTSGSQVAPTTWS